MAFKVGDVVTLKSGGPDMTITHIKGDDTATCVWFEETTRHEGNFPLAALEEPSLPPVGGRTTGGDYDPFDRNNNF